MTAAHRLDLARLLGLVLLTGLCISQRPPAIGAGGIDPDAFDRVGSRPLPRPDTPGEAMAFRHLQWRNENGRYPDTGLLDAKVHADAMRARGRRFSPGLRAAAPPLSPGAAPGGATAIDNGSVTVPSAGISSSAWSWLGPGNIGGRVRALVIDPTNTSVMFAGSVGGGIFKTTNAGASWAAVDDFMANLAVSTIVMQPGLPSTMYAGTGEGFYNTDGIRGAGVFKSTDSGTTWTQLASTTSSSWWYVNKLAVSPDGAVLLAATRTGIYKSTDGGTTWTNTSAIEMTDVTFHPTDPTRAIAGGYAGNVYRSIDGGATWTIPAGLPGGSFTRASVAYARSTPTTIYASIDVNGGSIYKSSNGGASFSLVFNGSPDYLGTQGWYGNALWVDPTNANALIVGGIDLWSSTNGGASFSQISNWSAAPASAHADQHAIVEQPGYNGTTNKTVWFTNDGGIYGTTDVSTVGGGASPYTAGWSVFNNNLGITQFYGAGGNATTGVILGGTQDNGTLKYTPATGTTWSTEFGGDGGESAVDPSNSDNLYGEYAYAAIHRSVDNGTTADWINGLFWTGTQYVCKSAPYLITDSCGASQANFIAPFVLDPNNASRLLVGGASLWRTNDATTANTPTTGPAWASVKAPLSAGNFISAIAVADGNADAIWVGHNNGQLFKTTNGTVESPVWTASGAGTLPGRFITRVRVDPTSGDTVYVTYGGFSSPNVWKTTDGGSSWTPAAGVGLTGLPSAPVRDLAIRSAQPGWLYAATEVGIFTSEDGGGTWTVPQEGPANVSVEELFWMGPTLVAVTHGRGIFVTTPIGGATTPVITWSPPADIVFGTALSSTQLNATASVPGTFVYSPPAGAILSAGAGQPLSVTFTPADTTSYTIATASVAMTVAKATPTITWSPPAPISYGTALSAAQLSATSSVPGALTYTPAAGTILDVGAGQPLSVTSTPTDGVNYTTATASVLINVTVAVPAIDANVSFKPAGNATSWVLPAFSTTATNELVLAFISAGGSSSNTVSGVTGASLTWVRVLRTAGQPGTSEIWRAFATSALTNASVTATLTTAARGLMTVVSFKNVDTTGTNGSGAIGAIATASPAGTGAPTASLQTTRNSSWVFGVGNDPDAAIVRTLGPNQTLVDQVTIGSGVSDSYWVQRTATPTPASGSTVTINDTLPTADHYNLSIVEVLPFAATPTVTWSNPADITYPTALGATQLNAAASVPGAFTYTPPFGSVLNAGTNQALAAHFVPTDTIKYASPPDTIVRLNVLKRTPTVTWGSPADIAYPTALSDTQLNATASVAGTFTYTPASGAVLTAGANQALSVHFVPTDTTDYNTPADTVVQLNVLKATPVVNWSDPAVITYPTPLSATQLNATASVPGTFTYTPPVTTVLSAGTNQPLTIHFVPTDTTDYNTPVDTVVHLDVLKGMPSVTWSNPADIAASTALSGTQLNAAANVPGTFTYTPPVTTVLSPGTNQPLTVHFVPTDSAGYNTPADMVVRINVLSATPTVTWPPPAAVGYGTALSAAQLNATANVPGTFVYSPPAGTVLSAAAAQPLSVTFTPADATNYTIATASVTIAVTKATPTVTWPPPVPITYGTALSAAQLNATASVPGTFVYSPPAGTVLSAAAAQPMSVTFTPTDATNYTTATTSVAITVVKVTPTVIWPPPAPIGYGTALSAAQLNATASVPGSFVYTPAAGTVLAAGAGQLLSMIFTPTDTTDYTTAMASVAITVSLAAPAIDAVVSTDQGTTQASISSPALSTSVDNELVLAFIAADYNSGPNTTVTGVSGGGLTWTLVVRANGQAGTSEIWRSFAVTRRAGIIVTATFSQPVVAMLTAMSVANVDPSGVNGAGAIGATATASKSSGAPAATLVTTRNNVWVIGVGNDYDRAVARTLGPAQTLVHQYLAPVGDTYWVQRTLNLTPVAGTSVTLNDTAPTADRYNFVLAELRPPAADTIAPTVAITAPVAGASVSGNGVAVSAAAADNVAVVGVQFLLDGVSLGAEITASPFTLTWATKTVSNGAHTLSARARDAANNATTSAPIGVTVSNGVTVTWPAPGNIVYGTALSTAQLNATASVPGTFVYSPAAGTVLQAGAAQTLSVTFIPTDNTLPPTAASVAITVVKATPALMWPSPAGVVYGTALSATQLNATVNVAGTLVYSPAAGTVLPAAASQPLSVSFTPTDSTNYTAATTSVMLTVVKGTPTLTWPPPAAIVYGAALTATQLNATANVAGTFVYAPVAGTVLPAGSNQPLTVTFTPTDTTNYQPAIVSVPITVTRATPTLTWPSPAPIVYGTALSAMQLNATANAPGTFAYTPAPGTVLLIGANQPLSVMFTPTDTANYQAVNASVPITVTRATPTLTWPSPAAIVYGTALSAMQLNATANVPGTFAYAPAAGAVLLAGANQVLSATFTPTDTTNYQPAIASVPITVTRATPTLTWPSPATIVYGTALSAAQLNATANVPGTFAYAPAAGAVLLAGANQVLSATFTPTDTTNYQPAIASVPITVTRATPTLTWPSPATIVYGTALGTTQLNATASVTGTFEYAPAAGSVLPAGSSQPLMVTFTPADAANYQSANTSVPITVTRATLTLTWPLPADIVYGTALNPTQLNATANVAGAFAYAPAAGTVLLAGGNQPLSVAFMPTDATNYQAATATVPITVLRATPTLTWPAPVNIVYGTALSAAELNATASVSGTFEYAPVVGTMLPAGSNQPLTVTFTPTDTTNFQPAARSVPITVTQATPALMWPSPATIVYGTALSATQLNATSNVPGTFIYSPAAGTVLQAGSSQTLAANFTPTDATNYQPVSASVPITVTRATPALTWPSPATIVYGTALSATQLNATSNVPGTFIYSPVAGTVLQTGSSQTLAATFTPTDTTNYQPASVSVPITVTRATPALTWPSPATIVYGTALSATQLNATSNVPGTFIYSPVAGTVLLIGANQPLSVTFMPTDTANYQAATTSVLITVVSAPLTIDAVVSKDQATAQLTISSPPLSTVAANELLLAFIATDYGTGANTTVTGVSGGGLTWTLVGRANGQAGTSEIWRAFAVTPRAGIIATASLSQPTVAMLTVMSVANVDSSGVNGANAIGATVAASKSSGAPSATLVTTRNNVWVVGVGNDYDRAVARTVGTGQTLVHQYLASIGDTYWVQRTLTPTAVAGTSVTLSDTAPTADRYNFFLAEIKPPQ